MTVPPQIQLTKAQTVFRGSQTDLEQLKATFHRQHWLRLPQLVAPDLLDLAQASLKKEAFRPFEHRGIGKELLSGPGKAVSLLMFLVNDPQLFDIVSQITGLSGIQCFTGRVYRMDPGTDHYDSWHDDLEGHRLLAMSLNLATEAHQGGLLQIRDRVSKQILQEVRNTTFGDAIIFRLSPDLQHRVTSVDGAAPRLAFAGWFRSQPPFRELLWGEGAVPLDDHDH